MNDFVLISVGIVRHNMITGNAEEISNREPGPRLNIRKDVFP